jgi:hypothetical protein
MEIHNREAHISLEERFTNSCHVNSAAIFRARTYSGETLTMIPEALNESGVFSIRVLVSHTHFELCLTFRVYKEF